MQEEFLRRITDEDRRDLIDQRPYHMQPLEEEAGRTYFEDPEDLYRHILRYRAPAAMPWRAAEVIEHELSHARYALAIGAQGVKYSVTLRDRLEPLYALPFYAPGATLPNLAISAVSANPYNSWSSYIDRWQMQRYGYASRQDLAERIHRWNEQSFGIQLPVLKTPEEAMKRIEIREQQRLNSTL